MHLLSLPARFVVTVLAAIVMFTGIPTPAAAADGFVGSAATPTGDGHWFTTERGQVSARGAARFFGDMSAHRLNRPVVGMSATASGHGYWLVASDGGIFAFGDARFFGSMGGSPLNQPIVGISTTPGGNGYWMVAADGGIFAFGDARFFGSMGGSRINSSMVGLASTPSGLGYWTVASDGGIFAFGDARFYGSMGGTRLNQPITAMTPSPNGAGYWLVGSDGGVFAFGSAVFAGSGAAESAARAIAVITAGDGYLLMRADGTASRKSRANLLSPPSVTPSGPSGPGGSWNLAFSDEFNDSSIDTTKWINCYPWAVGGCTNPGNNELQWYSPNNISESNGSLHMTARKQTVNGNGKTFNYTSGMVTTGPDMSVGKPSRYEFTYGYVEARVKVPKGKGLWPAIWLLPNDGSWPPEIDIMEILGDDTTKTHMTYHWSESGQHRQSGGSFAGPDFSSDFHTFGVDWQPGHITWYVDGVARRTSFTNSAVIPNKPMYVLFNLAVGGNWPGSPDANTPFPSTYSVDWVKVWKKA